MARTKTITDEQILEAARRLFEQFGFHVTTAQIAEEAGVSEGSIYRRWETKEELMINACGVVPPPFLTDIEAFVAHEPTIDAKLLFLASAMLDFFMANLPKMSAMMAGGLDFKRKMLSSGNAPPVRLVRSLMQFFEGQRRQGNIATRDPEVVARMFVGSLHHYAFAEFVGLNDLLPLPRETYLRVVVQNLLYGVVDK